MKFESKIITKNRFLSPTISSPDFQHISQAKSSTAYSGSSNLPTNLETNASSSTLCGMSSNDEIGCINKTTQDHNLKNITNVDISPNKENIQLRKRVRHDKSTINALRRMIKFDNEACSVDGGNIYSVDISEESHMNLNDIQTITLSNDEYLDLGDPIYNCEYCGAYMWYEERSEKSKNPLYPKFSHCCSKGKIQLPLLKEPPLLLRNLLNGVDPRSINYINNIRAYNMMFSFTSMGGKVDTSVNKGRGPYVFKIQGANYHRIGSLLPHRCESKSDGIRLDIVNDLKSMLDAYNPLAKSFRMAKDRFIENNNLDMRMKLIGTREYNRRMCNLPTAAEVAALIVGDIDKSQGQSLEHVDLFLPKPVFTHDKLYVAMSRVKKMDSRFFVLMMTVTSPIKQLMWYIRRFFKISI
ncbi:hypothetical protein OROMI_026710 [Orobanche minor]